MNLILFFDILAFCLLIPMTLCQSKPKPRVKVSQGIVEGILLETRKGRYFSSFIGIPYAQPPIGDLRFSSPVPKKDWVGVYFANNKKIDIKCSQKALKTYKGQEDCLYLNVFTPVTQFNLSKTNSSKASLPVMVFIPGGAFFFGSNSFDEFGPQYLLDKDIVLVTLNYRLGIFGFISTGDLVAPGNFGLKDQVLALKWVQENIQAFGGNPKKVTLFGESAGSVSISLHVLSEASNGLFHQYILQSGNAVNPFSYRNKTDFKPYVQRVARNFGCPEENSELSIKCLRGIDFKNLTIGSDFHDLRNPEFIWAPTDELLSKDAFLIDSPQNLIRQNKMRDYPFISGIVADEGLYLTGEYYSNSSRIPLKTVYNNNINLVIKYYAQGEKRETFKKNIEDFYFKNVNVSKNNYYEVHDKFLEKWTTFASDSLFLYPDQILLEKVGKVAKSPFYRYKFEYRGTMNRFHLLFGVNENVGVGHSNELLYLFHYGSQHPVSKQDERIIDVMIDLWTSFAIMGKPSSNALMNPNIWQPYAENKLFLTIGNMSNNMDPCVTNNRNSLFPQLDFWKKHVPISL